MTHPKPGLRLVPNRAKPASETEIAQLEFRALKIIRNLSHIERLRRTSELCMFVRTITMLAGETVAMTKAELSKDIEDDRDFYKNMQADIVSAKDQVRSIVDLILGAEARLMVALANVEGDALAEEANA